MQPATILLVPEIAHHMGLVPFLWLAWLHFTGEKRGVEWYWLAGIFLVSWLADTASHWTGHPIVGAAYPISQTAIVAAVLLARKEAAMIVVVLVIIGVANLVWQGVTGQELLLRTVAWGSAAGIVYQLPQLGRLRTSLLVTFGLGLISWYGYALWPGWTFYLIYQSTRLLGILIFCWASFNPVPHFKLSRRI